MSLETSPPWDVYLGAAEDPSGGGAAILMRDVSTELAAWERPAHSTVLSAEATDRLLDRIALLHAVPWSTVLTQEAARAGAAVRHPGVRSPNGSPC